MELLKGWIIVCILCQLEYFTGSGQVTGSSFMCWVNIFIFIQHKNIIKYRKLNEIQRGLRPT